MSKWIKVAGIVLTTIILVLVVTVVYVQSKWDRTFDVDIKAFEVVSTPEAVERGRYLVYGPAHCSSCHVPKELKDAMQRGEEVALSGGYYWDLPIGRVYSSNITPDPETGIGRMSDAQLARALRSNVRHDNRVTFPMMEFHQMSDEDLNDIIAYLRSREPVYNSVPDHSFTLLGRIVMGAMIKPVTLGDNAPALSPPMEVSIERGRYVANNLAACMACHTSRDMVDGSYIGAPYSGGFEMHPVDDSGLLFTTPNLTPDPETGVMHDWSEDFFVSRVRAGRTFPGSPMPWESYNMMSDEDLRAVYLYIMSLEPVRNDVGTVVRPM